MTRTSISLDFVSGNAKLTDLQLRVATLRNVSIMFHWNLFERHLLWKITKIFVIVFLEDWSAKGQLTRLLNRYGGCFRRNFEKCCIIAIWIFIYRLNSLFVRLRRNKYGFRFIIIRLIWIKTEYTSFTEFLLPLIFESELIQVSQRSFLTDFTLGS